MVPIRSFIALLKNKYDVSDYRDNSLESPLYTILQKLEQHLRLDAVEIAWLQETTGEYSRKLFPKKIRLAHHTIEAKFYDQEYKNTGNKWNLPNASSHWRKAEQPQQALKLTNSLNIEEILIKR